MPMPTLSFPFAALISLAVTGVPTLAAAAGPTSTLTHSATFTGAGGDASYGTGDTPDPTFNLMVYDLLPLFDPGLGTLQRVSYTLSGWRRFDGAFFLDALNLNTWPQEALMASINPLQADLTVVWPAIGSSLPIKLLAHASASGEIVDATQLGTFFTASGLPNHGIRLRFSPQDGGYFGMGGGAGFSAMRWDADATVSLSYHYTAAVVPEPAGWATLAAGLGALAWRRRRYGLAQA